MRIEFNFDKCIYCLENPADSWEHIIPECIGGRLQIRALCSHCNKDLLGSKLISKVKEDPSIRLAVKHLKDEIPELFKAIENGQLYFAKDNNETTVKLRYKDSKLKVIDNKKGDGSLVFDRKEAVEHIRRMLKKDGLSKDEIEDKIRAYEKVDHNKIFQLSPGTKVAKWSLGPTDQFLPGPLLDEKFIALTAYEFLSLLKGNLIFDQKFDCVREFIRSGRKSEQLVIEPLISREHAPYHEIYPEFSKTEIIINITLFGRFVYKVHLKGFKLSPPYFVYVEDLKNKKTLIAESLEKAKQGIWL